MTDLITPQELASARAGFVVLDVRWQLGAGSSYPAYLESHIPSAQWIDLDEDLCDRPGRRGRHPLPSADRVQRLFDRLGLGADDPVVVYDAADSMAAARAWWTLRWAGHSDVRVLDGGLAGWRAAGLPLATGAAPSRETPRVPAQVRTGSLAVLDADQAAALAAGGRLIDVRAQARYLGDVEPVDAVAGHIPGARNAPTTDNIDETGRFLAPEQLRERFGAIPGEQPIGVYCGSGVTAAHTVLALRLAGRDATLYPGSWSEWIGNPTRPVERGEPPNR